MLDEIQQNFVRSFIKYLKKRIDLQAFSPDAQESCEVAVQCLQAAFDLSDEESEAIGNAAASQPTTDNQTVSGNKEADTTNVSTPVWSAQDIDLFQIYENHYLENNKELTEKAESIKNTGNVLMRDGKYYEALLQYTRAIMYDPRNPILYCNRAAAHIRLADNERAITDCKLALLYNPNYGKAYGRLGIAYSNMGKFQEAQQSYARAIELEPDNQDYVNNMEVARNAANQARNIIPHLTGSLNSMLSNPTIRQIFANAEIDLSQVQNMSQNPVLMNTIAQVLTNLGGSMPEGDLTGGGIGINMSGDGGMIPSRVDLAEIFRLFAQQLASGAGGQTSNIDNNQTQPPQPPPPTS